EPDVETTVASIDVSFREPGSDATISDHIDVVYPYAATQLDPRGYFDAPDISAAQKNFVMLNIYVEFERAVTAFDDGLADAQTLAELDNVIAAVEDYNDEVQDLDIDLDLVMLRQLRRNLISGGVEDGSAPPRSNSWPAD